MWTTKADTWKSTKLKYKWKRGTRAFRRTKLARWTISWKAWHLTKLSGTTSIRLSHITATLKAMLKTQFSKMNPSLKSMGIWTLTTSLQLSLESDSAWVSKITGIKKQILLYSTVLELTTPTHFILRTELRSTRQIITQPKQTSKELTCQGKASIEVACAWAQSQIISTEFTSAQVTILPWIWFQSKIIVEWCQLLSVLWVF